MNLKKFLALFLVLTLMVSMAACGADTGAPVTEPSDVSATEEPTTAVAEKTLNKVVVYNSSLCTALEAFGKADTIVGAYGTLAENYGVPSCGKWNEVDVEAVIATDAEAVFGYAKYTTQEQIAKLSDAGIACYFIELSDADTAAAEVAQLGELFGCQEKAQVFVDLYNTYDGLMEEKLADFEPLTVYVEGTAKEPFKTANNTTAAHKLVAGAGLVNVYADNETAYPERNLEAVIVAEPDVIVKLCASGTALDVAAYDAYAAELAGVTAADNGSVILLNSECGTTAIGAVIGRLYIAKYVYPELFADVDVDAVYEKLCTEFFGKDYTGSGAFFK